jgi:hypothetical protein
MDALREVVLQENNLFYDNEYLKYTIDHMGLSSEELKPLATAQRNHAKNYTWKSCADSFEEIINLPHST